MDDDRIRRQLDETAVALLALPERQFGLLLRGDVPPGAAIAEETAVLVEHRLAVAADPVVARGPAALEFEIAVRLAFLHEPHVFGDHRRIAPGPGDFRAGLAVVPFRRHTGLGLDIRTEPRVAEVRTGLPEPVRGELGEVAETLLGAPALGHIADDHEHGRLPAAAHGRGTSLAPEPRAVEPTIAEFTRRRRATFGEHPAGAGLGLRARGRMHEIEGRPADQIPGRCRGEQLRGATVREDDPPVPVDQDRIRRRLDQRPPPFLRLGGTGFRSAAHRSLALCHRSGFSGSLHDTCVAPIR